MRKKNILKVAFSAVILMFSLNACSKCQTCTYAGDSEEICQDDYADKDEYKAYIALVEAFGASCK
jgi:hypothetical protein